MNNVPERVRGKRKWLGIVLFTIGVILSLLAVLALAMAVDGSGSWKSFGITLALGLAFLLPGGHLIPDGPTRAKT